MTELTKSAKQMMMPIVYTEIKVRKEEHLIKKKKQKTHLKIKW